MADRHQDSNPPYPQLWAQFATTTAPTVLPIDVNDTPAAAAFLATARKATGTGRLLGTVGGPVTDDAMLLFVDVLLATQRHGRVDVCWAHSRIAGVACWIQHPSRSANIPAGLPRQPRPREGTHEVTEHLGRLDLLDRVFHPAVNATHLHLACLGTETRFGSRMIADLLLHHQHQLADRDGCTLHTEVHTPTDRSWLSSCGYREDGISLQPPGGQPSYAMTRTPLEARRLASPPAPSSARPSELPGS